MTRVGLLGWLWLLLQGTASAPGLPLAACRQAGCCSTSATAADGPDPPPSLEQGWSGSRSSCSTCLPACRSSASTSASCWPRRCSCWRCSRWGRGLGHVYFSARLCLENEGAGMYGAQLAASAAEPHPSNANPVHAARPLPNHAGEPAAAAPPRGARARARGGVARLSLQVRAALRYALCAVLHTCCTCWTVQFPVCLYSENALWHWLIAGLDHRVLPRRATPHAGKRPAPPSASASRRRLQRQ